MASRTDLSLSRSLNQKYRPMTTPTSIQMPTSGGTYEYGSPSGASSRSRIGNVTPPRTPKKAGIMAMKPMIGMTRCLNQLNSARCSRQK